MWRWAGQRVWNGQWGHWLVWVWNLGLNAGLISLLLGYNSGFEAGEFTRPIFIVISIGVPLLTIQFLVTIAQRPEPQLYVALWYLIAAFVWTVMNLVLLFILPYFSGINRA